MTSTTLTIGSIESVLKAVESQVAENILVVWDIDDVILTSKDRVLRKSSRTYLNDVLKSLQAEGAQHFAKQFSIIWKSTEEELVEANTLSVFRKIKALGVKQIALSAPPAGPYGVIADMHDFRRNALLMHGIDFSYSFPDIEPFWLAGTDDSLPPPYYKDGVTIGGLHGKGDVLVDFLAKTGIAPTHVIFIDDLVENLENVAKKLREISLPNTLYHYESSILRQEESLIEFGARRQFDLLKEHGVWLNDEHLAAAAKHM